MGELGVGDEVRPIQHVDYEPAVQTVIGAGHVKRPVGGLIDAYGGRTVRRISEAARIRAADQISHAVETGHRHGGVDQRDLDLLAAAESVAGNQRQQDRIARRHARRHVDDRRTGPHRFGVGKTVQRHEAAFGLRDWIESRA